MLHNNTNIKTIITTSSAAGIDVFAYFRDQNGTLRPFFEKITTATDTELDISTSSVVVDFLSIKNIHASTSNTITLKKNDGTNNVDIFKVTLAAGEVLQYESHKGFTVFTADGKIKVQTASSSGGASAWGDLTGTLSDQADLQAALDSKEDSIAAGTSGQYWRGDKTWQTLDKTAVGLSNVVNSDTTTTANISDSTDKRFMTDAQETKLDSVESNADVTDATNVAAAGAYMLASNDADDIDTTTSTNKFTTASDISKLAGIEASADVTDAVNVGTSIDGSSAKTTPVDADTTPLIDSAASNVLKKVTWANIKATLKTYFDTLYQPVNASLTSISGLSPSNDDILQRKSGVWTNRTMSQLKTDLALVKGDVGLGNVDNTSDATKNSATATLTNKRITKRVGTDTSSATPTINTDNVDVFKLTAQAVDITSFTTNLTGTPSDFDSIIISITGTASRAITWGSSFENGAATLPTATSGTNTLDVMFRWNSTTSKWRCMAQG